MKKIITLLLILLAGCTTLEVAEAPAPPPTEAEVIAASEAESWTYTCTILSNLLGYDGCANIEAPYVVWTQATRAFGAYGAYVPGEPHILVDPQGDHIWTTVIHEMAHYVLYWNSIDDRCKSEEVARYVAGQSDPTWRIRYGCEKT